MNRGLQYTPSWIVNPAEEMTRSDETEEAKKKQEEGSKRRREKPSKSSVATVRPHRPPPLSPLRWSTYAPAAQCRILT